MAQRSRMRSVPDEIDAGPGEMDVTIDLTPVDGPLVTAGFSPLADFANFGEAEALMLRDAGPDIGVFAKAIAGAMSAYVAKKLPRLGMEGAAADPGVIERWLFKSSMGPFDENFADYVRELTHVDGGATFPGMSVALPPQVLIGLMAWLEGQILLHLGDVSDTITLSGVGAIWMDEMMLQLGIMLEPVLESSPAGPRDYGGGHNAELHPYAELAGFGLGEGRILGETGSLLAPAASGVISLAYTYLLSRPESAAFFQDSDHLAHRKQTLKAWGSARRPTPTRPGASSATTCARWPTPT